MKDIIDGILFLLICAMAYAIIYISCVAVDKCYCVEILKNSCL